MSIFSFYLHQLLICEKMAACISLSQVEHVFKCFIGHFILFFCVLHHILCLLFRVLSLTALKKQKAQVHDA